MERGILIIAQGKQRYLDMAVNIAISLQLVSPKIKRALVTDSKDTNLSKFYDVVIPIDREKGIGFDQKMNMDFYSPFQQTLFIDADCIAVRDITFLFDWMKNKPLSVIGEKVYAGSFIGTTVEELKSKINFDFLPSFNGGIYYFEKNEASHQIFEYARNIYSKRYYELKLWLFSGKPGDEPAMSIAMGHFGIDPVQDPERITMYTPVGQKGEFKMEVLEGLCEFEKHGKLVQPAVMHFGGGYPEAFHYKREVAKLKLVYYFKFNKAIARLLINTIYNSTYVIYVFIYRIAKAVLKNEKMKTLPIMPMFKFE